jgi:hypothetical protein
MSRVALARLQRWRDDACLSEMAPVSRQLEA